MKSLEERIDQAKFDYDHSYKKLTGNDLNVSKRAILLSQGHKIKTREIKPEVYLKRLSEDEQEHLLNIVRLFTTNEFQSYHCFYPAILAVGTTTYSDKHWSKLSKYLKKDKTKQEFAKRKGEDIDLRLVSESRSRNYDTTVARIKTLFDNHNIKYTYSENCDWGTTYLNVPKEYQEQEGQSILRLKGEMFHMPNFMVEFDTGRNLHLYIGPMWGYHCALDQIHYERAENRPFSILTRNLNYDDLEENVRKANQSSIKRLAEHAYIKAHLYRHIIKSKLNNLLKKSVVIDLSEVNKYNRDFLIRNNHEPLF